MDNAREKFLRSTVLEFKSSPTPQLGLSVRSSNTKLIFPSFNANNTLEEIMQALKEAGYPICPLHKSLSHTTSDCHGMKNEGRKDDSTNKDKGYSITTNTPSVTDAYDMKSVET